MERNGTLEMHPPQLKLKEVRERLDEEEEEGEEDEKELADVTKETVKGNEIGLGFWGVGAMEVLQVVV